MNPTSCLPLVIYFYFLNNKDTMDNYLSLVSKVLANQTLAKAIDDFVDEDCLNLISEDWQSRLENNIMYQNYLNFGKKMWRKSYSSQHCEMDESVIPGLQVVLVTNCKFAKPYKHPSGRIDESQNSLIISDSEPMFKIARAITSDLGTDIRIGNDFKFSFVDCSLINCIQCSKFAEIFSKAGYKIDQMYQPCISDTKVFNGESVINRFYSQIKSTFTDTFLAILRIEINARYFLKEKKVYRISGHVLDLIGFTENKLKSAKKICLGPLIQFEEKPEIPSIKNNKCKNSCLETKVNQSFEEYAEFVENDELFAMEEKEQCSNDWKRKTLSDTEEEMENEIKKQKSDVETKVEKENVIEVNDYEIEHFILG